MTTNDLINASFEARKNGNVEVLYERRRGTVSVGARRLPEAGGEVMQTKTYTTIDRAALGWPSGPWDEEPDKVQWQDESTGLPCLAVRQPMAGHWCGYVGVPPEHPLHGKDYGSVDLKAHGGITYSDACQGEPDHVWWFGFDCAHCHDYSPQDKKLEEERGHPFTIYPDEEYRTLEYVRSECVELAKQLAEVKT